MNPEFRTQPMREGYGLQNTIKIGRKEILQS
jgi:hypothetical protein